MRKLCHFGKLSANAVRHLPLPSFVRLAPRYLISSAAEPHVLTNNLQLPAKAQTASTIYV